MHFETIRLAGVDLDGTLLTDSKTLSAATRDAITAATRRGIHIVPITGRPFVGVPQCIRTLPEIEYVISSNGAAVTENHSGKALFSFAIDNEKSQRIIAALRGLDCLFEPFADGVGYAEESVLAHYKNTYIGTPIEDYIFSSRRQCDSYEALFESGQRCTDEFFVNCADVAVRAKLIRAMDAIGGLQYCQLGDRFIEITKKGTDKGEALAVICRRLNVDLAHTIAFGDGENDLRFLEKAGIAVAMENAFPSVKEKADIIAKSNNDDGVAEILNLLRLPSGK